jgi:hypothetical protein
MLSGSLGEWLPAALLVAVVFFALFCTRFALPRADDAKRPYVRRAGWVLVGIIGAPMLVLGLLYFPLGFPFIGTAFLLGVLGGFVPRLRFLPATLCFLALVCVLVLASPPFAENTRSEAIGIAAAALSGTAGLLAVAKLGTMLGVWKHLRNDESPPDAAVSTN